MWKVRLERWLTDGKSPDITLKSGFDYDLPPLCCEMLEAARWKMRVSDGDEDYEDALNVAYNYVSEHCLSEFAGSGFYPVGIAADDKTS